ncbi:MAG: hypothetical protein OEU68_18140 [Nitrospira sp.]|nr:hypothetical protein [Nitrospira sp.]MDH4244992.1 hypothetical protein [Nitrospira sp.]MDH4356565.1 hypothetical protein [Nitrospira sp.]MDH5319954.1 hypothetical protein [Nitrospira sp.]
MNDHPLNSPRRVGHRLFIWRQAARVSFGSLPPPTITADHGCSRSSAPESDTTIIAQERRERY